MEPQQDSPLFSYATKTTDEVLREFNTSLQGITHSDAVERLQTYGRNEFDRNRRQTVTILIEQFSSPFIYLLIVAALLALLLGERIDALMIFIFLTVNTLLGFIQEYRSEQTLKLLKNYVRSFALSLRNGTEMNTPVEELVPGDVITLKTGDRIPADVRFIKTHNAVVDETVLTGESNPVEKSEKERSSVPASYYECASLGFAGTTMVSGVGQAVVIATGNRSSLGKLSSLTTQTKHVGVFEKDIKKLSSFILKLTLITLVAVIAANIILKQQTNTIELLIFSVALFVSVIPEALPVVMTFSLARGSLRLAKNKVVVKHLAAIESLGSIDILCTDKTGTITENVLTVDRTISAKKQDVLFWAAIAANEPPHKTHEPFDKAIYHELSHEKLTKIGALTRLSELPFDPHNRWNGVFVRFPNSLKSQTLILRGAPEAILPRCKLSKEEQHTYFTWVNVEGKRGNRILAVAMAKHPITHHSQPTTHLTLIGLISFTDPIKPTTIPAIIQAKKLGVLIKIITGDNKETAGSVAHQVGLIDNPSDVITGSEFEQLTLLKQHEAVQNFNVFARISPEQKFTIVRLLQEKNEVGFLGEGINDAPALKASNVSIVVASASDIARDAADIVLLQKNLKVIIDGIIEGRKTFANTVTYIKATLASNFGNFYAVSFATLLIPFLPMLPIQILLVNLLSDFPMIAIATDTVDLDEIRKPRSYNLKDITIIAMILGIVSSLFDFIFFGLFFRSGATILQTNWFIGSILTELVFLFSIRTRKLFFKATSPSWTILVLTTLAAEITVLLPFTNIGQSFFHFQPPTGNSLLLIFGLVGLYFATTEVVKRFYYK